MQRESKNKQITGASDKGELQEFHFAGGGEYEPVTVKAHSQEEAVAEWERIRKKVEPSQTINE